MFGIVLTCVLAFVNPPVLPLPPEALPQAAEPTLDDIKRDAPAEIRKYIEAAEDERAARLAAAKVQHGQTSGRLRQLRSGKIVPRDAKDPVNFEHEGRSFQTFNESGIHEIPQGGGRVRFEFNSGEIKAQAIRDARTAIENAEADVRYYSRTDLLVHPVLAVTVDGLKIGHSGRYAADEMHRCTALQVVDGSNVIVSFEYQGTTRVGGAAPADSRFIRDARSITGYDVPNGRWHPIITAWLENVDTSRMTDGAEIDMSGYAILVDRSRTYETAQGGSNTVMNLHALDLAAHVPGRWLEVEK